MMANFSLSHPKIFDEFIKKHLQIENFSIVPLAGDASSRKYYRVVRQTESWVLMEWEPFNSPDAFPFISIQSYWHRHGIQVPEIIGFDNTTGLFLLEDLGDLTLERRFWEFSNQENIMPFYKATLDQLITLHRLILQPHKDSDCTAYQIAFDVEKFLWEMNYTYKNLFQILCPQQLTDKEEKALQAEFTEIAKTLADLPQVICHRDFHSRNVMIKGENIMLIDFQDARRGPPQYDLVSLIHDSYVTLDAKNSSALIDYYLKQFPEAIEMFSTKKEFMHFFTLQTLQRCFKACGTFAAILNQRNDRRYLKHLPHTLTKVTGALEELKAYPMISRMIQNLQLPQIEKWP